MDVDERKVAELFEAWRPWLEWHARHRAQCGPLREIDLEALPDAPPFVTGAAEDRYRRGYWHGYSQAMDDLKASYGKRAWKQSVNWWQAWMRVARFYDDALTAWRRARHGGEMDHPPTFDPKS